LSKTIALRTIEGNFSVCLLHRAFLPEGGIAFFARTEDELSLVCRTECAPDCCIKRDDHWCMFKVEGILEFSLIGILAGLTSTLAKEGIPVFAMSTFLTDYFLVQEPYFDAAVSALLRAGYRIL